MSKTPFKLKSGNSPLFKSMGSSPIKQQHRLHSETTEHGEKGDFIPIYRNFLRSAANRLGEKLGFKTGGDAPNYAGWDTAKYDAYKKWTRKPKGWREKEKGKRPRSKWFGKDSLWRYHVKPWKL